MPHRIDGKLYLEFRINGQIVPDQGNFFNHMTLTEGMGAIVPAMRMSVYDDGSNLADELALSEANTFQITVGVEGKQLMYTRNYRLWGSQGNQPHQGPGILIVGVLDKPKYYGENVTRFYSGSSDAAMAQLAGEAGLTYDGPGGTNDSQESWIHLTKTRGAYMQELARHGWTNDLGFMVAGVTSLGVLKYKDLTKVFRSGPVAIFSHNREEKGTVFVKDAKDLSNAGFGNNWLNYGTKRVEHRLDGKHKLHTSMPVQRVSPFLPVNSDVAGEVSKRARMDHVLLDCQNQHENYWKAHYQNQRKAALLSEKISILVEEPTKVQLFDLVGYRQMNLRTEKDPRQIDMYIVLGKSVVVKGGLHYAELITLARYTLTKSGGTPLE